MDAYSNIVTEWLRSLDLMKYADAFLDNGYDDLETCKQIGPEDLTAIGVLDPSDRGELLTAVGRLKLEGGTAVYFTLQPPDRRIRDMPSLSTNGYDWPLEDSPYHENGDGGLNGLPPKGYRRGVSMDTAWEHITRTGKSLNASPVRQLGASEQHRRSSDGKLLPTRGDRTPDLLKKVSQALSSSSSSFESVDAQTGSSTPFLLMAQHSDDEEPATRSGNQNDGADSTEQGAGEGMPLPPHRKMSTGQKAATAIRGLFKSKPHDKTSASRDPPEIEKAADLDLTMEELMEIQFAVSNKSITIDEAILQAKEKGLKNSERQKRKLSLKRNLGRKSDRPAGGRHKISSSEERLLPGTSASETSSVQDEGAITPPEPDQDTLQHPEYSHKIYHNIPESENTLQNRISMGSASSAELDTFTRHFSGDTRVVDESRQAQTNTMESNASTASFHSTSSWDSIGANHSGGVQMVDGPPKDYIAIGRAITDYTTSPYRGHLTLKEGDIVYITSTNEEGTSGEGVCNNSKGVFKYRHVKVLTEEELGEMDREKNLKSPEAVLKLTSVKELLKRINCSTYYGRFQILGVDTLGHFKNLSEESLDMLGVRDDKHRLKLLTARDIIRDPEKVQNLDPEMEQEFLSDTHGDPDDSGVAEDMSRLHLSPRDSGYLDGGERDSRVGERDSQLGGVSPAIREEGRSADEVQDDWGMGHVLGMSHDAQNNLNNSNNSNLIGQLDWCEDGHLLRMKLPGASTHRPLGGVPYKGESSRTRSPTRATQTHHQSTLTEYQGDISGVDLLKNHLLKNDRRHSMHRYERPWAESSSNDLWGTVPRHRPPQANHASQPRLIVPPSMHTPQFAEESNYFRSSSLEEPLFPAAQVSGGSSIRPSPPNPKAMFLGRRGRANLKRIRKSRSVSPHKRGQQKQGAATVVAHHLLHSSQSLGMGREGAVVMATTRGRLIERKLEKKLRQDGIDLRDEPYSNKMGFCGIPPALVQRYADEIQARVIEVADVLEDIRIRSLLESGKLSFKSDHLSREAEQLVLEGKGTSISDWLTSLGLPMYIQPFFAKGWDELHILVNMDKDDLQTCGVCDPKHLLRLQTALEKLRINYSQVH